MMRSLLLLSLLSVACSATFDPKSTASSGTTGDGPGGSGGDGGSGSDDDNGGSGSDGDDGGTSGDSVDDLEDLKGALDASAEGCQEVDGISHPGAASYFYGEFEPSDVDEDGHQHWRGSEEWLLYSNDAWRDTGVSDCVITWSIQGEEVDAGACAACDLSIAIVATVDVARTSCPNGLWEDDANYSVSYDVRLDPDGTSTWFFGASGTTMGTGSHEGLAMNYLTNRTCVWF